MHVSRPIGANDRTGLERQLRYMGRPPLSDERLTMTAQGKISVKLKTPWSDGTSHILMTPQDFMARLVALIPPPRKNQIRYHGVFAPNAKLRSKVVPAQAKQEEPADAAKPSSHVNSKDWARMMARVYDIDVLECPRCQCATANRASGLQAGARRNRLRLRSPSQQLACFGVASSNINKK